MLHLRPTATSSWLATAAPTALRPPPASAPAVTRAAAGRCPTCAALCTYPRIPRGSHTPVPIRGVATRGVTRRWPPSADGYTRSILPHDDVGIGRLQQRGVRQRQRELVAMRRGEDGCRGPISRQQHSRHQLRRRRQFQPQRRRRALRRIGANTTPGGARARTTGKTAPPTSCRCRRRCGGPPRRRPHLQAAGARGALCCRRRTAPAASGWSSCGPLCSVREVLPFREPHDDRARLSGEHIFSYVNHAPV